MARPKKRHRTMRGTTHSRCVLACARIYAAALRFRSKPSAQAAEVNCGTFYYHFKASTPCRQGDRKRAARTAFHRA